MDKSDPLHQIECKLGELQTQNETLIAERDCNKRVVEEHQKLHGEIELQKRKLQEQNMKLRDIIIKSGNSNDEPLDSVIVKSFGELRELIQKIVHKYYVMRPARLERNKNSFYEDQKAFYADFRPEVSEANRKFLTRAKIFRLIDSKLLSPPCFGLDGEREHVLAKIEHDLRKSKKGPLFILPISISLK